MKRSATTALTTYEYVVKYNSTSMWAYSVTYAIVAADEAYVITGTVTEDNEALLNAVRDSVESFYGTDEYDIQCSSRHGV